MYAKGQMASFRSFFTPIFPSAQLHRHTKNIENYNTMGCFNELYMDSDQAWQIKKKCQYL